MDKKLYVCGFLFSLSGTHVCLINKLNKDNLKWMHNLLNGVGGKVKEGEHPDDAMVREFEEEAGIRIWGWKRFCHLEFDDCIIHFYKVFSEDISNVKTMTDEEITVRNVSAVLFECSEQTQGKVKTVIPNLRWLIPMALDQQLNLATITTQ